MKKFLFYFALTGWTSALLVHLFSLADVDVGAHVPFVWLLHVGVFVVWVPAILYLRKRRLPQEEPLLGRLTITVSFHQLKTIFKDTPGWMIVLVVAALCYSFVHFFVTIAAEHGTAAYREGQYVLLNRGSFIRTLTEAEYYHIKASALRGFSVLWIFFYGVVTAVFFQFSGLGKAGDSR